MKPLRLDGVPGRLEVLQEARRLGCRVVLGNGGEALIDPPGGGPRIRLNNRRRDASRILIVLLRKLQAEEVKKGGAKLRSNA